MDTKQIPSHRLVNGQYLFTWQVLEEGYRWENQAELFPPDESVVGPWLIDPTPLGQKAMYKQYVPLQVTRLHRRFAKVAPTRGDIQDFANKYGLLTSPLVLKTDEQGPPVRGISINSWAGEIGRMAALVWLWDRCRKDERQTLRPFVLWLDDKTVRLHIYWNWDGKRWVVSPLDQGADDPYQGFLTTSGPGMAMAPVLSAPYTNPHLAVRWSRGAVTGPVEYFVCSEVNKILHGNVSPAVLPLWDRQVRLVPNSLLAALFLLFAMEISGQERTPNECEGCAIYFTPRHGRQRYHDKACRQRAHYRRKPHPHI